MTFSEDNESIRTPDADLGISRGGGGFSKKIENFVDFFFEKRPKFVLF